MTLHISIWSDVACPWCFVGKRRFEAALAQVAVSMGRPPDIHIEWKSFELDPRRDHNKDNEGEYIARLARKFGTTLARVQSMVDNMTKTGAEVGIAFDFKRAIPASTFDAHRLLQLGKQLDERGETQGLQLLMKEAFLRAHFEEGADMASHETLLRLAELVGLAVDKAAAVLASDDFSQEVRDDIDEARLLGVSGVPFFAIGNYGVPGAQTSTVFAEVIQKALHDQNEGASAPGTQGNNSCLPGEC